MYSATGAKQNKLHYLISPIQDRCVRLAIAAQAMVLFTTVRLAHGCRIVSDRVRCPIYQIDEGIITDKIILSTIFASCGKICLNTGGIRNQRTANKVHIIIHQQSEVADWFPTRVRTTTWLK